MYDLTKRRSVIVVDDRVGFGEDIKLLEQIKDELSDKEVELIFTDDVEIAEINEAYRGKATATDVLSFPLEEMPHAPLGTIIISVDHARAKADELGHSIADEVALLFIHGLLHLLGYDHEEDDGQMHQREIELIKAYQLPLSLIERNS